MKKILCAITAIFLLVSCCTFAVHATDTETLNLAYDVQARYEGMIEGVAIEPIVRTLYIEDTYDFSSWISVGLIDYSICQEHGTNCPNLRSITAEDGFFIEFSEGGEYVQAEHQVADLGGWSAVQVKISFTDAVQQADLPVFVRGSFYFGYEPDSEDGCKMKDLDFVFTVISRNEQYSDAELVAPTVAETLPPDVDISDFINVISDPEETEPPVEGAESAEDVEEDDATPVDDAPLMEWGCDIQEDVLDAVSTINDGKTPNTIYRAVSISQKYGEQPLAETMVLEGMFCRMDQQKCDALKEITLEDIQLQFDSGEELAEITLTEQNGMIYWSVVPTSEGKQIQSTAEVAGSICVMKTASGKVHISEEIPFVLTMVKEPSAIGTIEVILIVANVALLAGIVVVLSIAKSKKRKGKYISSEEQN